MFGTRRPSKAYPWVVGWWGFQEYAVCPSENYYTHPLELQPRELHDKLFNPPSPDFEIGRGGLILQLLFGFLFLHRLVQPVDFHWFSTSPFPLPSRLLSGTTQNWGSKPPQTSKNHNFNGRAAHRLKPLVLSKAVSCAVWEGLEGRREDIIEK